MVLNLEAVLKQLLPETFDKALLEYYKYANADGEFGNPRRLADVLPTPVKGKDKGQRRAKLATWEWWQSMWPHARYLAAAAMKITSMVTSAGGSERAWSAYDFVYTKRRNRLHHGTANDLVYVFCNMQLAARMADPKRFPQMVAEEVDPDEALELHEMPDEEFQELEGEAVDYYSSDDEDVAEVEEEQEEDDNEQMLEHGDNVVDEYDDAGYQQALLGH